MFFRKSVPQEYKDAYTNMDKVRQSFYNVREGTRKIYEARIDFISSFMCLRVKTLIQYQMTPWSIYDVWAPGYEAAKPISRPISQPMLMPIIVAKIIPSEGSSTIPQAYRDGVGNNYRQKLLPAIRNKCVYGTWNNRGSIFTMGFKLNGPDDHAALKSMETIFKEESHIHQFVIPFNTAVWNEEDLPPLRRPHETAASSGNQQNTSQQNGPASSGSQTTQQQNSSE